MIPSGIDVRVIGKLPPAKKKQSMAIEYIDLSLVSGCRWAACLHDLETDEKYKQVTCF